MPTYTLEIDHCSIAFCVNGHAYNVWRWSPGDIRRLDGQIGKVHGRVHAGLAGALRNCSGSAGENGNKNRREQT